MLMGLVIKVLASDLLWDCCHQVTFFILVIFIDSAEDFEQLKVEVLFCREILVTFLGFVVDFILDFVSSPVPCF